MADSQSGISPRDDPPPYEEALNMLNDREQLLVVETSMFCGASEHEVIAGQTNPSAIRELIHTAIEIAASLADPQDNTSPAATEAAEKMGDAITAAAMVVVDIENNLPAATSRQITTGSIEAARIAALLNKEGPCTARTFVNGRIMASYIQYAFSIGPNCKEK
ncbi:hypothetical protein CMQ_3759 [Grosmannia clavigera kw1407]|uniref:Uncharacterized protein n=1 Tax=Grosmannia clavigera (strain kw1407 / UAMH 11150) TaxID=655863 RepID=F0X8Q9_GROCL|nr:uncharacterized protein CMQ_3759 [Grosmannia clavigera kw1407]EFX05690.1 hypothetical protein CMQ_3759 [Grosmannia clavigera kw1407]